MTETETTGLRPAVAADRPAVEALLRDSGLPVAGIPDSLEHFLIAECQGRPVGVVGLEVYGDAALLRSLAVAPELRGTGVGHRLVERALAHARELGVTDVVLLTTTADRWFPRFGFSRVERDRVPVAVTASEEFRGACPASAVVMRCGLCQEVDGTTSG